MRRTACITIIIVIAWPLTASAGADEPRNASFQLQANAPAHADALSTTATTEETVASRLASKSSMQSKRDVASARRDVPWYSNGIAALGIVLLLIVVTYWAFRRLFPAHQLMGSSVMQVVGRAYITSKQSLVLVKVGDKRMMVLGVGQDHVHNLVSIEDEQEIAMLLSQSKPATAGSPFGQFLNKEITEYDDSTQDGQDAQAEIVVSKHSLIQAKRNLGSLLNKLKRIRETQPT